jgi:hypothetical protein
MTLQRWLAVVLLLSPMHAFAADAPPVVGGVEGQPLAANAERLAKALDMIGAPLAPATAKDLQAAIDKRDARAIQETLDKAVAFVVTLNPESRVKVARGPAELTLQQGAFVPMLVKVVNESTVKKPLRIVSPQGGNRFSGNGERKPTDDPKIAERFLHGEIFDSPPMTGELSGLAVEYAIGLLYSTESGKREATIGFDVGQGTQDIGFRGEVPVLFDVKPGLAVKIRVRDEHGTPTIGRFQFTDKFGHVFPPLAKRLMPDLFFQKQIYRPDGGTVILPPGEITVEYGRGPEYKLLTKTVTIPASGTAELDFKLERWIDPSKLGWFSGDHHIHAAGCKHYTNPTEGVRPEDMFLYVKGEGLNVGCCLTWGPCYDFQRRYFDAKPWERSEPFTILKYDVEVSGFGSQALGHVCLLNLREQTYPGSDGTKVKGWPTWTTPLMRWAKNQGAYTGYAHSANGLAVLPMKAAARLIGAHDANKDDKLTKAEAKDALLPYPFDAIDRNRNGEIDFVELTNSEEWASGELPNLALPEMNGIGAQEIFVTTAQGLCDFISAMDTGRVPEWNCWYHIMNCGFPLKVSGETDFPCITGNRVGQGRVYVQLGNVKAVDFAEWSKGLAEGRSYVSDGYAHALKFAVNGTTPGTGEVKLDKPGTVHVTATVAFGADLSLGTSVGAKAPEGATRKVDLVVNGKAVESKDIPADGKPHEITFSVPVAASSWLALRSFPQLHTNAVPVLVGGQPIRASRASAKWCLEGIEQLWRVREKNIAESERGEAQKTFQKAIEAYRKIAAECPEGS